MNAPMPTLQGTLTDEVASMVAFIKLLTREQHALTDGDTEALGPIGEEKAALVDRLNLYGEQRNKQLAAAGLGADRLGMEAWLAANPKDAAVRQQWARLKACVNEARELNLLNGKLIALRLQANQQVLGALLSTQNQNNLYGRDGQPTQLSGRRIIDAV